MEVTTEVPIETLPKRGETIESQDAFGTSVEIPALDCNPATLEHFNVTLLTVDDSTAGEITFTWEVCQKPGDGNGISHWNLSLLQLNCLDLEVSLKDLIKVVALNGDVLPECEGDDVVDVDAPCWNYGDDDSIDDTRDWLKVDNMEDGLCHIISITFDLTKLDVGYTLGIGCVDAAIKAGLQEIHGQVAGPVCFFIGDEEPEPEPICETAYAHDGSLGTCFTDIPGVRSNNWGWTIGPLTANADPYVFDLIAGAGGCNYAAGEVVGTLTVDYDGSNATVRYEVDPGIELVETHLYVGCEELPTARQGRNTVPTTAPGQYPLQDGEADERDETSATYTVDVSCANGIYVVAHSVVCYFPED